jgi:hypothetical protein
MAYRVNVTETVESAAGLNITGAAVVVRFHGGAQAPVYDAETGGSVQPQPLSTVNGKILASGTTPVWAPEGDYDLDVTFGSDATTFFLPLRRGQQFVTTLDATPEDGELAIELYDATNGGAWLKRFRGAAGAWDMIGGPPGASAVLPGTPRTRQEIYLTGGSPAIQHLRFNGASWDYVGTPPTVPVTGSPLSVLDVGQFGQHRAGRQLAVADFTTLLGLGTPAGLFNLGDLSNLGSGGALVNKGTVTFTTGIEGVGNAAAQFSGSTAQSLYIVDTGAADPFRINTGSWGCWFKTTKRSTAQVLMSKQNASATVATLLYNLSISSNNVVTAQISDGTNLLTVTGSSDVADDRWHHAVVSYDGTTFRLYVDGVPDALTPGVVMIQSQAQPFNIGSFGADASTAAVSPHFGRVDEAFVTKDVLSADQVRLLYATKFAHGYSVQPSRSFVSVRRSRRGAALATTDFPSTPSRLYGLSTLNDAGSNGVNLTNGGASFVAGADGLALGSMHFNGGAGVSLSGTDTGLPSGLSAHSYGMWLKSGKVGTATVAISWGTVSTGDMRLILQTTGQLTFQNAGDGATAAPFLADTLWHHIVMTADNAAADGNKRKFYVDGRYVGASTVMNSITLAGAGNFRIGANQNGTNPWIGGIDEVFVIGAVLTQEQIAKLYQKSSQALLTSHINPGDVIEGIDATNVYAVMDLLEPNYTVDVAVAA